MNLTKHCYELEAVLETLEFAIHANNFREILFWVHECIESGFARECWEWLLIQPPQKYIGKDESDWQPAFCYTMALRLARPKSQMLVVVEHETAQNMFPEPNMDTTTPRNYLRRWHDLYPYSIKTTQSVSINALGNWPVLCANTPYWQQVFVEYDVEPETALENETFSEAFGYELDELSRELQEAYWGIRILNDNKTD